MRKAIALLVVLCLWGCKNHDKEFEEILRLEDRRAPVQEFQKFTLHSDWEVKRRVALALGRLRDREAAPTLVDLLSSSSPEVRVEAAFALGQLAEPFTYKAILKLLSEEKDLEVRLTLIEALSKVTRDSLPPETDSTLMRLCEDDIPIVRAETASALGRLAHNKLARATWAAKLTGLLQDRAEEARWRAAYALMRMADSTAVPSVLNALNDRSARVRMQAARALGTISDRSPLRATSYRTTLVRAAHEDSDWRVRVNAALALGKLDFSEGTLALEHFPVADANLHVRIVALQALGSAAERLRKARLAFAADTLKNFLVGRLALAVQEVHWQERAAAARALAQLLQSEAVPVLLPHLKEEPPYFRAGLIQALVNAGGAEAASAVEEMANDAHSVVRIAVLEALPKVSAQNRAVPIYLEAVQSNDPVLVAVAAQNLAADSLQRFQHAESLVAAYRNLRKPFDAETAQMFFGALGKCGNRVAQPVLEEALQSQAPGIARAAAEALKELTGKDYSERVPRTFAPTQTYSFEEIKQLKGAWAEIKTDSGAFEIAFLPEEAPLTVLSFVQLAQKKYFDGQTIHRVVPNFVMQTGDPRGDGWGGPDYAIRSEFGRLRYVRGMVGMASSGPDTEGSQWFVTHSEQPHLDGRYTIFGRVRKGMEVVDELQVGHHILEVKIHR